ncbi:MAG: hypothetical protein FJ119_04515 [Deltaproteobacteria bacterium]|nr:hypothetical protein [Deltaproteobacteria bacterium]
MHKNKICIAVLSVTLVLYLGLSLIMYSFMEEDAYIYFRQAENIAHGHGYVFNQGAEHVEACSSITWLALLTASVKLGFDVITSAKLLGIFFGTLSLFMVFKISGRLNDTLPWVVLPCFLTAVHVPFLLWNLAGLETALYTFFIASSIKSVG